MTVGYIDYELDEEYPFLLRRPKQGNPYGEVYGRLSIPVYGKAVIAWNSFDDWWLDELYIDADNGKSGDKHEYWPEKLSGDNAIFKAVEDYLFNVQSQRIIERIAAAREDAYQEHIENRRYA